MPLLIDPPVGRYHPPERIAAWIRELDAMRADYRRDREALDSIARARGLAEDWLRFARADPRTPSLRTGDDALAERIATRVAELLDERAVGIAEHRIYTPTRAGRLLGIEADSDRGAHYALERLGIPTVRRSAGGKLRGYAGRDLIEHVEAVRKQQSSE